MSAGVGDDAAEERVREKDETARRRTRERQGKEPKYEFHDCAHSDKSAHLVLSWRVMLAGPDELADRAGCVVGPQRLGGARNDEKTRCDEVKADQFHSAAGTVVTGAAGLSVNDESNWLTRGTSCGPSAWLPKTA